MSAPVMGAPHRRVPTLPRYLRYRQRVPTPTVEHPPMAQEPGNRRRPGPLTLWRERLVPRLDAIVPQEPRPGPQQGPDHIHHPFERFREVLERLGQHHGVIERPADQPALSRRRAHRDPWLRPESPPAIVEQRPRHVYH